MNRKTSHLGLAVLLILAAAGCLDPKDRRPGLGLAGDVVHDAISDWSFSDDQLEIFLETKTWYMIPHSVTTVCAAVGDKLYVPTLYYQGGEWPDKFWNANVEADPRVRLQIGDKIYEREARVVEDRVEVQIALDALAAKYPFWRDQLSKPESERPDMAIVRMDPHSVE